MATEPAQIGSATQLGLFKSVIQSLYSKPAYVLIFGAILLNYLFCIALLATSAPQILIGASLLVMIVSTGIALVTVNTVEGYAQTSRKAAEAEKLIKSKDEELSRTKLALASADKTDVNIADPALAQPVSKIIENVRQAAAFPNGVFKEEIGYRLASLKKESAQWAVGELITDGANYERILQRFYREARKTVFATSNEQYLHFWREPGSKGILQAHAEAHRKYDTEVTRVFIFSSFGDISEDDFNIVLEHCRPAYITGKIFVFDEVPGKSFGSSLFKDFVVIDRGEPGQAVGVTNSFETGAMTAKWMLEPDGDTERAAHFIKDHWCDLDQIRERLSRAKERGPIP
jgi:hypothetical protein